MNSGFIIVLLEPWKKRDRHGVQIMRESFGEISKVPGVLAFPIMPQGIRTGGIESPVQFVILGNTYDQLIEWKERIKKEARKNPGLTSIEDDFDLNKPQLNVKIDQKKAADLGVSTEDIGKTIETIFGSRRVTNFTKDGKEYSIILQGDIKDRQEPESISKVFVRSKNNNKLVSISNLVAYDEEGQSPFLARYNRQKAVTISARLVGDYSLDEALKFFSAIPAIAKKLATLEAVGLGYIHLGQAATTLSGGEAQRVKLSRELSKRSTGRTLSVPRFLAKITSTANKLKHLCFSTRLSKT